MASTVHKTQKVHYQTFKKYNLLKNTLKKKSKSVILIIPNILDSSAEIWAFVVELTFAVKLVFNFMLAKSEESPTLTAKHIHQVYGNTFPILKNRVMMLETWAFFLEFNNCNKIKKESMKKKLLWRITGLLIIKYNTILHWQKLSLLF